LEKRLREGQLSARGLDRVRRVALTVSDLAGRQGPLSAEDVLLALALRAPGALGAEGAMADCAMADNAMAVSAMATGAASTMSTFEAGR
jgi:hypothetical protein